MRRVVLLFVVIASVVTSGCTPERMFSAPPRVQPSAERTPIVEGDVLYVLNGKVLHRDAADTSAVPRALRDLQPDEIEAIEVLKGQTARKRYGPAGENGVVVITTRPKK